MIYIVLIKPSIENEIIIDPNILIYSTQGFQLIQFMSILNLSTEIYRY